MSARLNGTTAFPSCFITATVLFSLISSNAVTAATRDGAAVYAAECAQCHDQIAPRMPSKANLAEKSPRAIVQSLESGAMRVVGTFNLNGPERIAVAEYLTGRNFERQWAPDDSQFCQSDSWDRDSVSTRTKWDGWGNGAANTRFQNQAQAKLARAQVPQLELAWAFAFPGETIAESQPTIYGGRLFVGSRSGRVYALDATTGCVHWTFDAAAPVKTSVLVAPLRESKGNEFGAFFSDLAGNTYGVNAETGREIWRARVEPHPTARIMGSLQYANNQLLIPLTSTESYLAADVDFACCKFRGNVTAVNPVNGKVQWRFFTVPEAQETGVNTKGVKTFGPAGATIWSTPTYDEKNQLLYVGTGENSSNPPTKTSDAILAIDPENQKLAWSFQGLSGDAWNMSCTTDNPLNCPTDSGPDYDFGSSPIIAEHHSGRRILIAAQKSGVVHALDPDNNGELLWQRQIAKGGVLGGIEWGPAADEQRVYVAIADIGWQSEDLMLPDLAPDASAGGGLVALDLLTGEIIWEAPGIECGTRPKCSPAQTAAVTAIPGVVFSGSISGHLRAFDAETGKVIWSFDTAQTFDTVNGAVGRGGAIDATGPIVADGMLYTTSGYSKWGGLPGNVLLAFKVGKALHKQQ
ncbi:MAG: outer membrane protein assembly factor BamB family protein [Gammaproteobacteria bacterium]